MTDSEFRELQKNVLKRIKTLFQGVRGGHDLDHTMRVCVNAEQIADMEKIPENSGERMVIRLAALLHDCARPEEDDAGGKVCHAKLGRGKSKKILTELGCNDESLLSAVGECVGRHRYRGTDHPQTLPEKIVYDADKLDSIGAVGIGRAFHFASRCGARLHNPAEIALAGESYGPEDSAYREYLVKLQHVPGRMLTGSGRMLAAERAVFMKQFFEEMNRETEAVFRFTGECP